MKILISGSSGLVGSYLVNFLAEKGHEISKLVRDPKKKAENDILWNPLGTKFDPAYIEDFRAIIHLAGENISSHLWTKKQKGKIKNSRVNSTNILAQAIARLEGPKPVFLCASATGIYGDRGDEVLTEQSAPGEGFLADVVREWEGASKPAENSGTRVVNVRTGIVLSDRGGILKKLLPVFKFGLGGKLGNGQQYMPWISLADLACIFEFCLVNDDIAGPVNAVAPEEVSNTYFTKTLASVLSRPAFLSAPASLLNLVLGEMADELLLSSARVESTVLKNKHFSFLNPTLKETLEKIFIT